VGTLLLFGQDQNVTSIEDIEHDVYENLKQERNEKKVVLTINGEEICFENIQTIKYIDDLNWDFGY